MHITYAKNAEDPLPKWVEVLLVVFGLIMSLFWIKIVCDEMVGICSLIAQLLRLKLAIVGLTILAVGNSVADFMACLAIARRGRAAMALSGIFGGPTFNLLVGLGLVLVLRTVRMEGVQAFAISRAGFISIMMAMTIGPVTVFMAFMDKFRLYRRTAIVLLSMYLSWVTVVVLLCMLNKE
uniref:Sodium/calcium exchanger membrane region domain-containing protein n=1 Tax=Vitrella brassicaformis TaxID=1169539 RepID=A0A7S1KJT5_9ALVE